ncbi:MAG: Clp protease N-terminal domain-containing protein [Acidobacteriota bacterium]|nr:Clp protease N-terminal domain-containing protein [Acidobacteriota bacterium]
MFENFSMRTGRVLFWARFKAGQRGAGAIGVDDLLLGILIEDQGKRATPTSKMLGNPGASHIAAPSHSPFFRRETATDVLSRIESLLPASKPIGPSTELPLSADLERVLVRAKDVQEMFHHSQVEPLHLLAAALTEGSSDGVNLLQEAGFTKEQVLEGLKSAADYQ